jgi:hypothetical protein
MLLLRIANQIRWSHLLAKGENPDQAGVQNGNDSDVLTPQPSVRVGTRQLFFLE